MTAFLAVSATSADLPPVSATPDPGGTGKMCLELKPGPTDIAIELFVPEPEYDLTRNIKFLSRDNAGSAMWLKENGLDELWSHTDMRTNGDTASGWELQMEFLVVSKPVDRYGAYYCPHILEARIDILLQTKIRIASEYPRGTCQFDAIDAHEYKHFLVNRYVAEQAVQKLRRDLPVIIRDLELEGYVGRGLVDERVEVIRQALRDVVQIYMKEQIRKEMMDLNAKVDTPDEYDRVSQLMKICEIKDKRKKSGALNRERQETVKKIREGTAAAQ